MKTDLRRLIRSAIVILLAGFVAYCAQYNIPQDISGPAYMEVSPHIIVASSGQVHTIWVTVLDDKREPLQGVPVSAKSDTPNRVLVTPENSHTDKEGKAIFTAKAISYVPGTAHIVFTASGLSVEVDTDFIYQ